ncbi:MAG TPA: radical SAM protein [Candidatus Hydrogenedentes bacterium]|nr:radical SAM protein [Candidatus Hydrogenedentota bacterium]
MNDEDSKAARLLRWQHGETPGPWQMVVFPTNRCNLRCGICWQRWAENEYGALDYSDEIPDSRLLRLVDEAADMGVREWSIGGGGEPLVRAGLVEQMCMRIRERGMNGGLFTNGTLFKEPLLRRLVDIGWERIDFSLDGPSPEINDAIRGEGSFERTMANMRTLARIRRETGKKQPVIDIHMVLMRNNADHLDAMFEIVEEMMPSSFGLGALQAQSEQSQSLILTPEQMTALPELLENLHRRCQEKGIGTNAQHLLSGEAVRTKGGQPNRNGFGPSRIAAASCFEPWLTATILPQGYVGPCCAFWDVNAGNIRKQTLSETWTGSYMTRLREDALMGNLPQYCQWCPSHLRWQTEQIRRSVLDREQKEQERLISRQQGGVRNLPARLARVYRAHGVWGTFRRAYEWVKTR